MLRAKIAALKAEMHGRRVSGRYPRQFDLSWRGQWVPSRFPDRHIDNLPDCTVWPNMAKVEAAAKVISGGGILALAGQRGTGKTQMACLLAESLGQKYVYLRIDAMFRAMKSWFDLCSEDQDHNNRMLRTVPLLVLDEVQESLGTQFEAQAITSLIDKRYGNNLPTVLISNLTEAGMAKAVGHSIMSRLQEGGALMEADWPSFREKGAKGLAGPEAGR